MSNNSAISDVAQKGMKAANTVKSAVKLGKSIAAAAKGGAAGGWIGAAAAFAWENRRLVAAIIVGLVVILLIPVIIICMLPSLIFGGISDAFSPIDADNPIINNVTVIAENMKTITDSLEGILTESLKATLDKIDEDKATLPEGTYVEIVHPVVDETNYNKSLLISQYCASREKDYKSISISDFENTVKQHSDKIFYYEKTDEVRQVEETVIVVDSSTGKEKENIITVEKNFTIYTVFINSEEYFADNIFKLTDSQKELAKNYTENLNLYLNGGI